MKKERITAVPTPSAITPRDHITVLAKLDTLEMVTIVQVNVLAFSFYWYQTDVYLCSCNQIHIDELFFLDMNECEKGTHDCSINAMCYNTNGSYECTCNPGYTGDGRNCTGDH